MSKIKDFVVLNKHAVLSTLSKKNNAHPFGSIVPYDVEKDGSIIIFISLISEHYKNLENDARSNIFISDPFGNNDPQANSRVSILTEFAKISDKEFDKVSESYWNRFPNAKSRSIAHNFCFFRSKNLKLRWISGFGEMGWIEEKDFSNAPFDEISYIGMDIIQHMNEDHKDALSKYIRHYHRIEEKLDHLEMVSINKSSFEISINKNKRKAIQFSEELKSASEVRQEMISLLRVIENSS